MDITITEVAGHRDRIDAAALLHDFAEWMAAAGLDLRAAQSGFAEELRRMSERGPGPGYRLFLARMGWLAVGTVGVRVHPDGSAELKRMYVRPFARGRGVADRLVRTAVAVAAGAGCGRLWLETKQGLMDPAIALYGRHGFAVTADHTGTLDLDGILVMTRPVADPRAA